MSEVEKIVNGEVHTRESIVERHKGLVYRECHKLKNYAKRVGQDFEDIVSVGFIGLISAFDKFDGEQHDVRFSTYAVPSIWGGIQNFLRRCGTGAYYSVKVKELGWNIRKNDLEDLAVDEIAEKLDVNRTRVIHALDFLQYGVPGSLDQPIPSAEGERNVADLIGESDDTTGMLVQEFLDSLTEREQIIIVGLMDGKTQREIAIEFGISRSRIWSIKEAVAKKYLAFSEPQTLEREPIEIKVQEGGHEKVGKKNDFPTLTEVAVNAMRDKGMTYAAIAEHFGISAPTLATRRQNWELERVRAQCNQGEKTVEPSKSEGMTMVDAAESSVVPSLLASCETKITELKDVIRSKDSIIQEQQNVIDQLKVERDELVNRIGTSNEWQEEIRDERKLLAILLEREAIRIKNLLEVG